MGSSRASVWQALWATGAAALCAPPSFRARRLSLISSAACEHRPHLTQKTGLYNVKRELSSSAPHIPWLQLPRPQLPPLPLHVRPGRPGQVCR